MSVPICLRPNTLLETGRVSYSGVIQLLPRAISQRLRESLHALGSDLVGVRDCFEARPGWLYYSNDLVGGELVTFAESACERVGFSRMGELLNAGQDVHIALAAQFIGMSYDEFSARKKERRFKDLRQAAKPINFGCPGGIGAPKIVLQQRKQGPDTPCPGGPVRVWDGKEWVDGYKGLRFCILVDGATACGREKITEWNGRPCPPLCGACVASAARLREGWFRAFPEARPYLDWHAKNSDEHGWVRQVHGGRVRGGTEFCSEANGDFQELLARAAKRALWRVTREQYVNCGTALYGNARGIVFAHDELFGEVLYEHGHEVSLRVNEIMVEEFRRCCPRHAKACKAEPTLMGRWWKAAEPVWHAGRLAPWTPEHDSKTCAECKKSA